MPSAASTAEQEAQPDEPATETQPAVNLPSLSQVIEYFDTWEEDTRDEQKLGKQARDYYDGDQWTPEEEATLNERNQPIITVNRIARKVNFILGEIDRKSVDPVARPRTPQHEDSARAATDALRYVEESEDFDELCGEVAADDIIEGRGAALVVVEEEDDYGFCVKLKHVPWDRFFYDPKSRKRDFSDAKYLGLVTWMDLEDAKTEFPDAADALELAVGHDTQYGTETTDDRPRRWADGKRKRVKIAQIYLRIGRDYYVAKYTKGAWLEEPEPTGYLDEKGRRHVCPLIATSCYIDNENRRYGLVRHLISLQDEINKRRSKLMHGLNVRQVIAERDVVRQPEQFLNELAKPDGFAEVEPGTLAGPDGPRIQINTGSDLGKDQALLLQEAKNEIDTVGPSSSTLPDLPDSSSGRAFLARQQAASQEIQPIFSALRQWRKQMFRHVWMRIRQFWTEEKWLRVTDDQELRGFRFVVLNQQISRAERLQELLGKGAPLAQALDTAAGEHAPWIMAAVRRAHQQMAQQAQMAGQPPPQGPDSEQHIIGMLMQHPLMAETITVNQVDQLDVDILIDESPETAVIEQEEFESLSKILPTVAQARPDMAPLMVKTLLQASQVRAKREILQEMNKGPDPKVLEQQQMLQQMQQQMAQLQAALTQAQVQKTQADAGLAQAKTQSELAGLSQPQQMPEQPSPLEMARAERESVNTQLDIEKTRAQVEKERSAAAKNAAQAASTAHQMMQPAVVEFG